MPKCVTRTQGLSVAILKLVTTVLLIKISTKKLSLEQRV